MPLQASDTREHCWTFLTPNCAVEVGVGGDENCSQKPGEDCRGWGGLGGGRSETVPMAVLSPPGMILPYDGRRCESHHYFVHCTEG